MKNEFHSEIAPSPSSGQAKKATGKISSEALAIMESADKIIYCPEKYFAAQKSFLIEDVQLLRLTNPDLPLRQVVVTILRDLPDFLPADNLVEVTRLIAEQWQKLNEEVHELAAA